MVIVAIIRVSRITGASGVDVPWSFFWQFMEASIAVLMASLTVFRTLFVASTSAGNHDPKQPWPATRSIRYRAYKLVGRKFEYDDETQLGLPEVPSATLTGLRTFIRRNKREPGLDTSNLSVDTLCMDNTEPVGDQQGLIERPKLPTIAPKEKHFGQLITQSQAQNPSLVVSDGHSRMGTHGSVRWTSEQGTFAETSIATTCSTAINNR